MAGRVRVTSENGTGRNATFTDSATGKQMTRAEFVRQIESGHYSKYHVRRVNGVKTPVSNPDRSENNNLG